MITNGSYSEATSADYEDLYVQEVLVGPSQTIKRMIPRAKGSGSALLKRTCNVRSVLNYIDNDEEYENEFEEEHVHDENCEHNHMEQNEEAADQPEQKPEGVHQLTGDDAPEQEGV